MELVHGRLPWRQEHKHAQGQPTVRPDKASVAAQKLHCRQHPEELFPGSTLPGRLLPSLALPSGASSCSIASAGPAASTSCRGPGQPARPCGMAWPWGWLGPVVRQVLGAGAFRTIHAHLCTLGHESAPDYALLRAAFASWTPESLPDGLSEAVDPAAAPSVQSRATQTEQDPSDSWAVRGGALSSPAEDAAAQPANGKRSQGQPGTDAPDAKRARAADADGAPSANGSAPEPAAEACYQQLSDLCSSVRQVRLAWQDLVCRCSLLPDCCI